MKSTYRKVCGMETNTDIIPTGWKVIQTGGGATSLYRAIPDSVIEHEIVQSSDPLAPDNASEPCRLIVSWRGDVEQEIPCTNLADAISKSNSISS